MDAHQIGELGEEAACEYLKSKGYFILQRNFRCKTGEIDIIAVIDGCTVFAEVKTRKNDCFGAAAEFVDYRKQAKIKRAAMYFLKNQDEDMRFDVIEVYHSRGQVTQINHITDAF
ncbi:MAG: YraN family protein [Clostridia bacterium]|nr:YraN family protein [Clostridia bacterium]